MNEILEQIGEYKRKVREFESIIRVLRDAVENTMTHTSIQDITDTINRLMEDIKNLENHFNNISSLFIENTTFEHVNNIPHEIYSLLKFLKYALLNEEMDFKSEELLSFI